MNPRSKPAGRRRTGPKGLFWGLLLLALTGCGHHAVRPAIDASGQSPLQRWTGDELAPYLAQQLARHPRFKGEPVVLVRLPGSDISPEIDNLTRSLRDQIRDVLLSTPGVRLPWQSRGRAQQHHRRPDGVDCRKSRDADYFIGVEIGPTANRQYRVSVRALDARAGEWVSGFGKSWVGLLTAGELAALRQSRGDESLRGLRVLPFGPGQSDLAAAYLANNLSCLLRQQAEADLLLFVEPGETGPKGLPTLLRLVGNNLSRYREVRVTDRKKEADLLLRGEAHEVQPGLYQVWMVLHPKSSGEHLTGIDTATYLHLSTEVTTAAPMPTSSSRRPARPGLELVHSGGESLFGDTCGERSREACGLLEVRVRNTDQVFLFALGAAGDLGRLYPGSCRHHTGPAQGTYRFPNLPVESDGGTIYALAVNGSHLKTRFSRLLQGLPDACGDAVSPPMTDSELEAWLGRLDHLIEENGDRVTWAARRLP